VLERAPEAGLRIDDPTLSREHARFLLSGSRVRVEDLGSKNDWPPSGGPFPGDARASQGVLVARQRRAEAARKLGMPVRTLSYRLKVLGVKKPE
jgi:pSer/pThr/pTyr-binding forkhead associated (FHA) protein